MVRSLCRLDRGNTAAARISDPFTEPLLEFGQTWYCGSQPVHVYFFKPCYGPQIPPRYPRRAQGLSQEERLIISKDYVDADALNLSGFQYQILPSGEVLLDPSMDTVSETGLDYNF